MNIIVSINKLKDLKLLEQDQVSEVLICLKSFSRFGQLAIEDLTVLLEAQELKNKKVFLVWDILMTENTIKKCTEQLLNLDLSFFDGVRVQDPGAFQFIQEKFTEKKLQIILESGHRNLESINNWITRGGSQLDKIILSPELSKVDLKNIIETFPFNYELLAFGKILLFYSPRELVSSLNKEIGRDIKVNSEESPHKGFRILENQHGTFMFNPKSLNLTGSLNELEELGIHDLRFDLEGRDESSVANFCLGKFTDIALGDTITGFFHSNRTDVLFKKLKNQRLLKRDESYIGEIVNLVKSKQIALLVKNKKRPLKLNDKIRCLSPEGKEKVFTISSLKNISLEKAEEVESGEMAIINYHSGLSVKTAVYWE